MAHKLAIDAPVSSRVPRWHARVAAAVFIALIALSAVVGYLVFRHLSANEQREAEETLGNVSDIEASAVSAWVQERLNDASVFGAGRFLGEAVDIWIRQGTRRDGPMRRQLREQLNAIQTKIGYLRVAIVGIDSAILVAADHGGGVLDRVASETVQRAFSSGGTTFSSIHDAGTSSAGANQVVDIATPLLRINDTDRTTASVLLLEANADPPLDPFVRSLPVLGARTEAFLVEIRDGKVVATSTSEIAGQRHFFEQEVLPLTPQQLRATLQGPAPQFVIDTVNGGHALAVARPVNNTPWFLVTSVDQDALWANLHRTAWTVAAACAVLLMLMGLTVLSWWRGKESEFRLQAIAAETERESLQRQYDYLSRYANDMIILLDAQRHILDVNDKTLQVLGYRRAALTGAAIDRLFPPAAHARLNELMERLRQHGALFFEVDQQRADGSTLPTEISARATRLDGREFLQFICRDITERKQAEAALRASEEKLNGILTAIMDVVWSFSADLSRLNYINQSADDVYGYPVQVFMAEARLWFDAIHPDDRADVERALRGLRPEAPGCEVEHRIVRRNKETRWLRSRSRLVLADDGSALRVDGVSTDVTLRRSAEQQVQALAYFDNVTGLPNRALVTDRLGQAIHMAMRSRKKVALLFMDLDNFKYVNDSLGHHVGDMLLRAIGESLQQCVREEDTVGRLGGDEFLVVLPDIEKGEQAVPVAEKILALTARPFALNGQQINTTISIGISVFPDDGKEPFELMRHADSALYQAKSRGRDNYQFFTQEMNFQIVRNTAIERQLRHAIDSQELSLWYQPQIDTRHARLVGAEALLRWRQGDRDFLSPVEFIPVAEERGLIGTIGEWVLREACRQCRQWQDEGLPPIRVAVNVSPLQFQQKGFADLVISILREAGLDAGCLELEITESAIMRRAPLVAELARQLRDAGVGISIDDFGTGYSSLSYLKHIPIDKIKIDRSFISDMLENSDDEAITLAIVSLARSLKLQVLAEGVESHAQLERLRAFGCTEVQGMYYSGAVAPDVFRGFLHSRAMVVEAGGGVIPG